MINGGPQTWGSHASVRHPPRPPQPSQPPLVPSPQEAFSSPPPPPPPEITTATLRRYPLVARMMRTSASSHSLKAQAKQQ
jgi:hypothetical protein